MSYKLNKTDGTLLTDLIDGQIDSSSTNLILVGRNYLGFGEFLNENLIKLLENFANTAPPSNPLEGQLWWDKTTKRLQVFNNQQWKSAGGPFVQNTQPQMVAGDLWINNESRQMYFFDGANLVLVGPSYNTFQQTSGLIIDSITDIQSRSRTVAKLFIGGSLSAVLSDLEFVPAFASRITELVTSTNPNGIIRKGINVVDVDNFKYRGIATASEALVNAAGQIVTASQFLPSDGPGETSGTLTIRNNGGIIIGLSQNNVQKVVGQTFTTENQLTDQDYSIRVKSSAFGTITRDAIYVKSNTGRVGIWNNAPEYTLDVTGDLRVTGNLLVEGSTTSLDVSTLRVEDKNIELGLLDDSTAANDALVDGGGIILRSTNGSKDLLWNAATNAWTSNVSINLLSGRSYKINGVNKLSLDRLDNSVLYAEGLVRIGTLEFLNVDSVNINGSTITTSAPLNLTSNGTITVNNRKITGVSDPTIDVDVANKRYVDTQLDSERVIINLDITGLSDNQIGFIIESVFPASEKEEGTDAYVITQTLSGSTATNIDIDAVKNVSFVAVDSNGTQNESVVQDINFFPATGNVNVSILRGLKRFEVESGAWTFKQNVFTNYTTAPDWP